MELIGKMPAKCDPAKRFLPHLSSLIPHTLIDCQITAEASNVHRQSNEGKDVTGRKSFLESLFFEFSIHFFNPFVFIEITSFRSGI